MTIDYKWTRRYTKLLATIAQYFKIRKLEDHVKNEGGKVCYLRHDVDRDLIRAVKMATLEKSMGIKSTYFMLHTADYYKEKHFFETCQNIRGMGHEIGIHINIIPICIQNGTQPEDELNRLISEFESHGITIHGTAAHGTAACKKRNVVNYDIFTEISHKDILKVGKLRLKTFSLVENNLYEAYHVPYTYYFSDSGGIWRGSYRRGMDISERITTLGETKEDVVVQILKHPCWKC